MALPQAAVAHADDYTSYEFGDPSKNIACMLRLLPSGRPDPDNTVQCDIDKHTWVGPQSGPGPCPQNEGYIFMLRQAGAPEISCLNGSVLPTIYTVLEYGQTRTAGAITCNSEPSGMTCTNTNTRHFFRLSRDSYQVG
jgi:hypothetical protein